MSNREKYKELCHEAVNIPLFLQNKWLNAVCGDKWDVIIISGKEGNIKGVMPYYFKKRYGFRIITMPSLTPYLGPWFFYPENQKQHSRISYEHKITEKLLMQLPQFDSFIQYFHPYHINWLPFHWNGFKQSSYYTYILKDLSDLEKIFSGFRENIRREIRKAEKNIKIVENDGIIHLYDLLKRSLGSEKDRLVFSSTQLKHIYTNAISQDFGKMFTAYGEQGEICASLFLVWDNKTAYYLAGASDDKYKTTGAMSFLMWHAIQFASKKNLQFDFEGSMLKGVERFFRAFGGELIPYYRIEKINSLPLKVRSILKG